MRFSAPGKLVVLGDYAVLAGAPAMVAAISRRGHAARAENMRVLDAALIERAFEITKQRLFSIEIDTSEFKEEHGRKLGIGSSSVAALLAIAVIRERIDQETLNLAVELHRKSFGKSGSGIDVAASYYGGIIETRFQPAPTRKLNPSVSGLYGFALYAGQSAKTRDMVEAVRSSPAFDRFAEELGSISESGISAWEAQNADEFVKTVRAAGETMAGLGKESRTPIVTQEIAELMRKAVELGGAAKPSGAGGGDVVLVFAKDPDFGRKIASQTKAQLLDLKLGEEGLREEEL